jgi:uncharacterized protein YjbI with pentapeptide repeats
LLQVTRLDNAVFYRTSLFKADLSEASIREANMTGANLSGATLHKADLQRAILYRATLAGANLFDTTLHEANLCQADLRKANLSMARMHHTDLSGANLTGAVLEGIDLKDAVAHKAIFTSANLSDGLLDQATLSEADLSNANLHNSILDETDLSKAILRGTTLSKASLIGTKLRGATLERVDLSNANLVQSDLREAMLAHCLVYGINAWDIQLEGARQQELIITNAGEHEPVITVDDLETGQMLYLLLKQTHSRVAFGCAMPKGVLVLARRDGGYEEAQSIAARLRELDYQPILVELSAAQGEKAWEMLQRLASVVGFVIADIGGPEIAPELITLSQRGQTPIIPFASAQADSQALRGSALFAQPWVYRPPFFYQQPEELSTTLPERIVSTAQSRLQERQQLLERLFPHLKGV